MEVRFLTPLRLEKLEGKRWVVYEAFAVAVNAVNHVVPHGYITDLASVPRVPLAYLLAGGRAPKSAVLHDWLYTTQAGKDYADEVFYWAMKAEKIPGWIASLMNYGVRAFGAPAYEKYSPKA